MTHSHIYGLHAVLSLLQHHPERVLRLCVQRDKQEKKLETLLQIATQENVVIALLSKQELDRMTQEANHQGVIAECKKSPAYTERDLASILQQATTPPFVLVLDGVQDPHNLGACFRAADAAGVHAIIAPKDKAVGVTAVVSKVASGAVETVPFVQVTNLVRTLEILKELGVWIYGACAEAKQTLYQTDLTGPVAMVLGAEGTGLRRLTREHCDALINIPMRGTVASLNVSVAAGIFLFEVVRQQQKNRT